MNMKFFHKQKSAFVLGILFCCISVQHGYAATDKYRLSWTDNTATTMTIGFRPITGTDYHVMAGNNADGTGWLRHEITATRSWSGFSSQFVKLTELTPNSAYHFKVCDSEGCSTKMWFKTAPDTPSDFTFVAGGDSRTNAIPRRWGNELVAHVRPLFVLFGGDYMDGVTAAEWYEWLDDWQLTRSDDGRMYPIIATHGNHENDRFDVLQKAFDAPYDATNNLSYYALNVGGDMMRIYALNSEKAQTMQRDWLVADLDINAASKDWLIAAYHKPIRPHTSGKSEGSDRSPWASTFFDYGVDLAIDSDSHMSKYTYPIRPEIGTEAGASEGFIRDDDLGTVHIGEGSWGAPNRPADDDKPWTLASGSFYQFKLIQVTPTNLHIRSVRFEDSADVTGTTPLTQTEQDANPLAIPTGLDLWAPAGVGEVYTLSNVPPFSCSGDTVDIYADFNQQTPVICEATEKIITHDSVAIMAGADVSFRARLSISLDRRFKVQKLAIFRASITGINQLPSADFNPMSH